MYQRVEVGLYCFFAEVVVVVFGAITIFNHITDLLKAILAPRLYLIEYLSDLIK